MTKKKTTTKPDEASQPAAKPAKKAAKKKRGRVLCKIRITAAGQTSGGEPLEPGTIIEHPEAWRHCLPGFNNSKPIAEPADDETRAEVERRETIRKAQQAQKRPALQKQIDLLAKKYKTDEQNQFVRTPGGFVDGASDSEQMLIDTAANYGIVPTPPVV